jgi:hypothetical protein
LVGEPLAIIVESFQRHLSRMLESRDYLLDKVDDDHADELGRRGAEAAVAPLIWGEAVGERWSTTETAEFLGVTSQALHDRVKRGTLLGLPGRGVTWFPTWQLNLAKRQVRTVVADLIEAFRDIDQPLEAVEIGAWARRPRADLDDLSPGDWIAAERADGPVITAALRSAAHLQA